MNVVSNIIINPSSLLSELGLVGINSSKEIRFCYNSSEHEKQRENKTDGENRYDIYSVLGCYTLIYHNNEWKVIDKITSARKVE